MNHRFDDDSTPVEGVRYDPIVQMLAESIEITNGTAFRILDFDRVPRTGSHDPVRGVR